MSCGNDRIILVLPNAATAGSAPLTALYRQPSVRPKDEGLDRRPVPPAHQATTLAFGVPRQATSIPTRVLRGRFTADVGESLVHNLPCAVDSTEREKKSTKDTVPQ